MLIKLMDDYTYDVTIAFYFMYTVTAWINVFCVSDNMSECHVYETEYIWFQVKKLTGIFQHDKD